jgi:DnaJ-class molecular chaperone
MAKCNECNGKGVVPCPVEYGDNDHPDDCRVCAGDKKVRVTCPDCKGSGKYKEESQRG